MALLKVSRAQISLVAAAVAALVAAVALAPSGVLSGAVQSRSNSKPPPSKPNSREIKDGNTPAPKSAVHGSIKASERLMKELRDISKSESYKNGVFSVELEKDNLYEWNVKLFVLNPGQYHKDLHQFRKDGEEDHIMLRMSFSDQYPNEPPFVRVVYPYLTSNYVMKSGVICMEMLTKQGWVPAYDIETLIVSIIAVMVDGKTQVDSSKGLRAIKENYTPEKAREGFWHVLNAHKDGWDDSPKREREDSRE